MQIALSNTNNFAEISDIDSDVEKYTWTLAFDNTVSCAQTNVLAAVVMQRVLGRAITDNDIIIHIDSNRNNNTRENLELASTKLKIQNKRNNGLLHIPPVSFLANEKQWIAKIEDAGNNIYLGPYDEVIQAANAYNKWMSDNLITVKLLSDQKNVIQVSFADADLLEEPWHFKISGSSGDVERFIAIKLARLIMQRKLDRVLQSTELVKHLDKNTLNIQRENLEVITWSQLQQGKKLSTNTSGYIGVSWVENKGLWRAQIGYQGKKYYLGLYPTRIEAAAAYDEKALELFGPNAKLNQ